MSKKLFYFALMLFVVVFSSCERNNELVGTTWTASREGMTDPEGKAFTAIYSLKFKTNTTVNIKIAAQYPQYIDMPDYGLYNRDLTYSYENSVVIIDNTPTGEICTGTVNGNQLVFQINENIDNEDDSINHWEYLSGLTFVKE